MLDFAAAWRQGPRMGEIINLRRARKARKRQEAEARAATNRAAFGRTAGEKAATALDEERRESLLRGARLGRDETDDA